MKHTATRRLFLMALVVMTIMALAGPARAAGPYYVRSGAPYGNGGDSWADAYSTVKEAINAAAAEYSNTSTPVNVYVAKGTYTLDVTIDLPAGVRLYGGLSGDEGIDDTNLDEILDARDIAANATILDGGGTRRVIECTDNNATRGNTILDGFTITGGNATDYGGGMYISGNASPTIENCTFTNNKANNGGGMYCQIGAPRVRNCTFTNNMADDGGGMYCHISVPRVRNCTFVKNTASRGNELYAHADVQGEFINTLFWNDSPGDIIYKDDSSTVTLTNCAGPTGMTGSTADPAYVTISNWTAPRSADVPVDGVTHTVFRIEDNLTALSDLINKGTSMSALADDQLGTPRKSPPDIGAVEHVHAFGTDWEHDDAEHWHECACGEKEDQAAHAFSDWTEKPATATEDGKKERSCTVCGHKETQTIPKTGGGDDTPDPGPTGDSGATLSAVGVPTTGGMAEVPLSGIVTFELGMWFGEDRKPATPQSLTVYVDGKARGEVSVTNGRFILPSIKDDEYELWVEATLPDGSTLKSDKLYVVAGRGTLSAPDLKASPTSAEAGERVTFDLGEWINKREVVVPEGVRWILNGADVTDLVVNGVLTVEAIDGGDGTMTLFVTATLANGLTGTATVRVTVTPAPDDGDGNEEGPAKRSGGCFNVGFGGLAMMACAALILRRRS